MSAELHALSPRSPALEAELDVDSAATTLLASAASSKAASFEDGRRFADSNSGRSSLRDRDEFEDGHQGDGEHASGNELDDDDDGGGDDDTQHLLTHDTTTSDADTVAVTAATHPDGGEPPPLANDTPVVTWSSLPKKSQLAILTISRLSEPLTQTSLAAYMFYQLKSFPLPSGAAPSDATVAQQVGVLAAAFTGAQFLTAIAWGRAADSGLLGRKRVILIGLLGTAIGSVGFGFSTSFAQAVFWRCAGGILNGNVGVMRTMISEIVREKKFQSRAFLLMPMTFNIGVIIGPLLGGLLADPVASYPATFGPGSALGGADGVWWLTKWPYALPNVVSAAFLAMSGLGVFFGLEETSEAAKHKPDYGLRFTRWLARVVFRREQRIEYSSLGQAGPAFADDLELEEGSPRKLEEPKPRRKLPFRRIWTSNLLLTLLSHGLLAMHVGTFSNLWFVFLSTPRYNPDPPPTDSSTNATAVPLDLPLDYRPHLPFTFTGGLGLPPPSIGSALAILGVIGISMQLLLYPRVSARLGTTASYRLSIILFPISYTLAPFLAVIPSAAPAPHQASGALVWLAITLVLVVQVTARTFALPATAILVNNACPHPSVLGTVHGIAQSVSSATRTFGPVLAAAIYGQGLRTGVVGLAWWFLAAIALFGILAARFVREGDGHEVWLEGEKEESEEGGKI